MIFLLLNMVFFVITEGLTAHRYHREELPDIITNGLSCDCFGDFERLIKFATKCLRKILNFLKVDFKDLLTFLVEIHRVINNHPLNYNYNDVNSKPSTTNYLIFGSRLDINYVNENRAVVKMNLFVEKSIERFWKLWSG